MGLREFSGKTLRGTRNSGVWFRNLRLGRAAAAERYWSDPANTAWHQNSHWRDALDPDGSERWDEIGRTHLAMYQRFERTMNVRAPQRILEWGVGGGSNAVRFAPLCDEFIAVDVVQDSLNETVKQVRAVCATPVTPVLVSVEDQSSGIRQFYERIDLFVCFYVLELVPDEAHAHEIVRIAQNLLIRGGTAIFQVKYKRSSPRFRPWKSVSSVIANQYTVDIAEFWEFLTSLHLDVHYVQLVPRNQLDRHYAYFFVSRR